MQDELIRRISMLVAKELNSQEKTESENKVPIGISARHVHLCREHIDILFGKGYQLTEKKELMGGQYAAQECVTLVGTKLRAIESVRILGPERKASQVEVSKTDAIRLGINPPVRESGNTAGSAPIAIVGPKGAVYLDEGCIVAKRHIHMSPADAENFGVTDGQIVSVKFDNSRGGTFEGVQIRVDKTFTLEMHIDTDEANGLGVGKDMGIVIK
ncbi:putative phosphotransacetylase [Anaerobium acetethylicum]|uniref:Phosphate propanoyltransferase n=2 Tax=Anaerobium acetethylicum TaxID=1619234 RepID=A0A1D3TS76_9FIRM|nr:phosphate propanoyltransferase [Anaerobium acetethylicum]SCP96658.1 putative phosphotransacetylase [Anaerobium acetethylicum]